MPHSYFSLLVHVVFGTKDRVPYLDATLRPQLFAYMGGIVRELKGAARIINGIDDHAHGLLSLPADISVAECLRVVKTNSSRWVHETFPDRVKFAWQTGYGAFAVSASNEASVVKYIQDQEGRHKKMTFEEEFKALLKKHGIAFDPKYLWT
jgi:REP element-mobilizing transposase RayT